MRDQSSKRLARVGACLGLCILSGCQGGLHREGDQRVTVIGGYGDTVSGDNVWPDGEGHAESVSLSLGYDYYTEDRLALSAVVSPWREYNQSDGDVYAGELQIGIKYHFLEFEIGETPIGFFGEVLGGLQQAAKSIPEEGSHTNFTQDTGVGFEVLFTERLAWISGWRFRHLSNGYIFGDENPSQNEHWYYTGIAIELKP